MADVKNLFLGGLKLRNVFLMLGIAFLMLAGVRAVSYTHLDVYKRQIYHWCDRPVEVGSTVVGQIQWEERFEKMQQHSGEHIVSGLVHEKFGYNNVGFHLGGDYCTMDFDGPITKDELKEIERLANEAVYQKMCIRDRYKRGHQSQFHQNRYWRAGL